ncbi:MAG: queG [Clostridiales bacterium]|jgi:epoxyqueuosine reductase QueG|nr:queG [Clostridiales bacterium]
MDYAIELQDMLKSWGASVIGFSKVTDKLPENLKQLKYAITIGVRLSDFIIDQIDSTPTYTYFHHYRTVNSLIDYITLRGTLKIMERGFYALAVPASQTVKGMEEDFSGIFPHKTAAVMSGLGWIGKNGLFISNDYGPRIRLGTILTDMELPEGQNKINGNCGSCRQCVESCPAMALTGNCWAEGCERGNIVDAKACSDWMNTKYKHIGRGSVCGICIRVCPHGIMKNKSNHS